MKFFCYTQGDDSQPLPVPSETEMQAMGELVDEAISSGTIVATGGFAPSASGTTVRLADGEYTVTDGPYAEAKELIGGWALIDVASKDEAIAWTKRFLGVLGSGDSAIRQVFTPDDFTAEMTGQEIHDALESVRP